MLKYIFIFTFSIVSSLANAGDMSLYEIVRQNKKEELVKAIKNGIDMNEQLSMGETAFSNASSNASYDMTKIMLENGANPNLSSGLNSVLDGAVKNGDIKIVKLLLDNDADVNNSYYKKLYDTDPTTTPLHEAAKIKNDEIIKLLLANGANKELVDMNGKKPFDYYDFNTTANSKYLELYEINKTRNLEEMNKTLAKLKDNYMYFSPTENGISVRKGAGTKYGKHGSLKMNPDAENNSSFSNIYNIAVDTRFPWIGGVISNIPAKGDEKCPVWYEIVAITQDWSNFEGEYPDYSGLTDNKTPAYVCADYVKTRQITDVEVENFANAYFKAYKTDASEKYTHIILKKGTKIPNGNYDPPYIANEGEKISLNEFSPSEAEKENEYIVRPKIFLDDSLAIDFGYMNFPELNNLTTDDEESKKALNDYISRHKAKF